jgi:hypothetical protein
MGNVWGKEKPLKEVLRENKRMINKAVRELDREKAGLEKEEKRLTMEIKKAARDGQMASVKIMAKVSMIRRRDSVPPNSCWYFSFFCVLCCNTTWCIRLIHGCSLLLLTPLY